MKSIFLMAQDSGWYPEFLKPVVKAIANIEGNKKILDIGTGPGKLPELLIKQDTAMQITGIDISRKMIDEARKRVAHKNVSFQSQKPDATLEFADREFDVVTFCSVLFLVKDSTKTFLMNEALRVLKPNGKILILTPTGQKSTLSAFSEVLTFPYSKYNWTFIMWKKFTSNRGREWQKQKFLSEYSTTHKLQYTSTLTFNNNASIEIITKSNNN